MFPNQFDYYRPASVQEAIQLLQQNPEAKLLAGGHSLLPLMKLRLAQPSALIDITRIPGLTGIRRTDGSLAIGAATTYRALMESPEIRERLPLIPEAVDLVGDLQVRNRGTIGGALAHADPAGDLPAVALALEAELKAVGPGGERRIKASDFFVGLLTTALQPNEVLTEITIPLPQGKVGMAYEKFASPASGYAIVGVAAVVGLGADGKASTVRVAVTGAGPVARRLGTVESALTGSELSPEQIRQASQRATEGMEFMGDIQASEEYRAHLTRVYVERALTRAAERALA